jgi:flagellar motility protein MotE (MotC chaperone)
MNIKQQPLVELTEEALTVLQRELGTAKTIRFIRQFSVGFGDYTAERAVQPEETLDELLDEIKKRRLKKEASLQSRVSADISYQQRLDEIRQQYPRAYEKWTEEEDTHLRQAYQAGTEVKELAVLLQRQLGAVESRLRKLGLTS